MALTSAEKQRRYRERKKKQARSRAHVIDGYLKTPFDDWIGSYWASDIVTDFDILGIPDRPSKFPVTGAVDPFWDPDLDVGPNRGAIGAAERMADVLLDAGKMLAYYINKYKLEEIATRMSEIEAQDLSVPETKKQALAEIAKLSKFKDELSKSVRWNVPQWEIKGE